MTLHAKYEIEHGPIRQIDYINGGERNSVRIILRDPQDVSTVRVILNELRLEFERKSENGADLLEIQNPEMPDLARNLRKKHLITKDEMYEIQREFLKIPMQRF